MTALKSVGHSIGVVGPRCRQGNGKILTHDFVNRVHMEIFNETYYPMELTDWWLDDWISQVYGEDRTMRAHRIEVLHHTAHQKRRYDVNRSTSIHLNDIIRRGQRAIKRWMTEKVSNEVAAAYEKDINKRKTFSIKDVPEHVYKAIKALNDSDLTFLSWNWNNSSPGLA